MIITEIYKGQGLGNQLWCYVVTRVIAEDKKYKFGIKNPNNFKCLDFLDLNFGENVINGNSPEGGPAISLPKGIQHYYRERKITHPNGSDIRIYDQNLINIPDNTKIDGVMQDEKYILHRKEEIRSWLKITDKYNTLEYSKENICIINFRGGEYIRFPDLFLTQKYWNDAIKNMRNINPNIEFIIVTDDIKTARKFFPSFKIIHQSIGYDYSILNNAYYLILSNSSFAFFPAWLNQKVKKIIAPKYWARHNVSDGYWSCGYNIVKNFTYQDRDGTLFDYDSCIKEFDIYIKNNISYFKNEQNINKIYELSSYSYKNSILKNIYKKISKNIPHNIKNIIILKTKKLVGFLYRIKSFLLNKVKSTFYSIESAIKSIFTKKITEESLLKYRNKIKLYDIFTYNGEIDILKIRLNILNGVVDKFIIIEAPTTFSGLQKPLYFQEQRQLFAPFLDKINYFVINDYPNDKELCKLADESSNVPKNGPEHWRREFYQKESIKKALINFNDDDICFIGDVDEIWNPLIKIDYTKNDIFKLEQEMYTYYLNNKSNEPWAGTIVTKYKNIKNNCLNHLRTKGKTRYTYIKNGGWHFTNMGGLEEVRRKLNDSYTEESYNSNEIQYNLEKRFGESDYLGRKFKYYVSESNLPKYLLENKDKYKKLFK